MSKTPEVKKVNIGPIACYQEAYEFLKNDYATFWALTIVGTFIGNAVPIVLQGPMYCGLTMCFIAKRRMEHFDFNLMFRGFDYFGKSIVGVLCSFGVQMVLFLPIAFFYIGIFVSLIAWQQSNNNIMVIPIILFYLAAISYSIVVTNLGFTLTFFTCCLMVDRQMDSLDAFKIAFHSIRKNLWQLVLHALIGTGVYLAGMMACGIGLLFLIPLIVTAEYMAYEKVFGLSGRSPHEPTPSSSFQPAQSAMARPPIESEVDILE